MNPYESAARTRKAHAVAEMLALAGITAEQAATMQPKIRQIAASAAKQHECSDDAWAEVVKILRTKAEMAAAVKADPFAGLETYEATPWGARRVS